MNSFEKNLPELLAGNTDVGHVIVARRAFVAGLRRAAEIAKARSVELAKGTAYEAERSLEASGLARSIESEANEVLGSVKP